MNLVHDPIPGGFLEYVLWRREQLAQDPRQRATEIKTNGVGLHFDGHLYLRNNRDQPKDHQ